MAPIVLVSADGHVTCEWEAYRAYVDRAHREDFDGWLAAIRKVSSQETRHPDLGPESQWNSEVRQRDLESQGVAAEVLFPNGAPFWGLSREPSVALSRAGKDAYNRWLADFCSTHSAQRAGLMMLLLDDLDETIQDVYWAKDHGLRGVLLPGMDSDGLTLMDERLDPVWAVCEETGLPVHQHCGAGLPRNYPKGFAAILTIAIEGPFYSSRCMWHMILGGVFERFPRLNLVITESLIDWIPGVLRHMDWLVDRSDWLVYADSMTRARRFEGKPSDYWRRNCFACASFISREEIDMRRQIGVDNLMFGIDYPHLEGTYPLTKEWLQGTFGAANASVSDTEKILGENAIRVRLR